MTPEELIAERSERLDTAERAVTAASELFPPKSAQGAALRSALGMVQDAVALGGKTVPGPEELSSG